MKNWRTTLTLALTLGLTLLPLAGHADEAGSMNGEHKAHHATPAGHTEDKEKKAATAEGEAKKAGSADGGTAAEQHHDQGEHEGSHEEMEEGSH